jgi:anti-sigma regulatory factor (Ser/Thr protein kinase)
VTQAATASDSMTTDDARSPSSLPDVGATNREGAAIAHEELELPGDLASVAESRERIMQFVCQHCRDEETQIDLLVAVQEALANAARHGCGNDAAKRIKCSVAAYASHIMVTLRDPGPGFDIASGGTENFATSTASHGRGILLMRNLMTDVSFARGGSEIRLLKQF